MPRNRMIKPTFWEDAKLAEVSRDARLIYVAMWNHADDYGVCRGHPVWLKGQILPYDKLQLGEFEGWLKELEDIDRIVPFIVNEELFYNIPKFKEHQTINRPSKQRNPEPPSGKPKKDRKPPVAKPKKVDDIPYEAIVNDFNAVAQLKQPYNWQTHSTQKLIKTLWNEGNRLDDFKHVHRVKTAEWKNDKKMKQFLRLRTLYTQEGFEEYKRQPLQDGGPNDRGKYGKSGPAKL